MFEAIAECQLLAANNSHLNLLLTGRFLEGDMCKTVYLIFVHWQL